MDDDDPINPAAFRRAFNRAVDREVAENARLDGLRAAMIANQNLNHADGGADGGPQGGPQGGVDDGVEADIDDESLHSAGSDNNQEENENDFEDESDIHDSESESDDEENDSDNEVLQFANNNEREEYVFHGLRDWAVEGGTLSMRKLDKLLAVLHPAFPNLPLSHKTLLDTPKNLNIFNVEGGAVWYKGITTNLNNLNLGVYLAKFQCITVDINFDGLPIHKKTLKKFWPTLAKLVHTKNEPFIVSIFFGQSDPSADVLLRNFVEEVVDLQQNGFLYNGVRYDFKIRHYICDAPARAKVKGILEHGAIYACEKCEVEGEWIENRTTYVDLNARLRTDETFTNREQEEHHREDSLLEQTTWGPVSQFRLDAMHLLHSGAFKRLLKIWKGWNGPWKLSQNQIAAISVLLSDIVPSCPSDFNRKPKPLNQLHIMKATEFRRMLLYDGPVVFKEGLNINVYKHFLLLHCGSYILSSPTLCHEKNPEANEMLRLFITHGVNIYRERFVVYNVHSLCHLADECENHNNLDSFSAYPFENKLKSIKESLRSGYKPLEQAANRDLEKNVQDVVLLNEENQIDLAKPHFLPGEIIDGVHFNYIKINEVVFKRNQADSCFKTINGDVVVLHNIVKQDNDDIFFIGYKFQSFQDLYDYPIPSSEIGILSVSDLSEEREAVPLAEVYAKCWLIPSNEDFACFPLLHSVPLLH